MPLKQKVREATQEVVAEERAVKEKKQTTVRVDISVLGADEGTLSREVEGGTTLGELIDLVPVLQGPVEIVVNNERVGKNYKLQEGDLVIGVTKHIVGG